MPQKSALQTSLTLFVWLFLQNFNFAAPLEGNFNHNVNGFDQIRPYFSYKIKRVVLDAGHGGKDPGCIGVGKNQEKDNTLAIILALGEKIEAEFPDIEVIYTRKTDVFIELNERAAIANRNNADLFISVHCNSMSVATANGAETYVMGLHRAADNLEVAKRENASIYLEDNYQKNYGGYDPNSAEAHIIGSVWQSSYLEQSILFAQQVQTFSNKIANRVDRGVKQAGFLVLRETAMPSVLIEAGYLTNKKEDEYLLSEEGRNEMAASIFEAFKSYKSQMEGHAATALQEKPAKKVTPTPVKQPAKETAVAEKKQPANVQQQQAPQPKPVAAAQKTPVNTAPAKMETTVKSTAPTAAQYQILLLAWPGPLDRNAGRLALLNNVKEVKAESEYRYYYGPFTNKDEAEKMLPELKNMGFKTASIEIAKTGK